MSLTQVKQSNIDTSASQLYGMRNRIINGDMRIDQRNAGASVTVNGVEIYGLDRWKGADATDGDFTMQQSTDVPSNYGFQNSLKVTVGTADTSIGASQYAFVRQVIEGYNSADLAWGSASAKSVTVSFWVKASVTGTYSFTVINGGATHSFPFSYTINSANTWEFKTITITGAPSGTWLTTNGIGIYCDFSIACGTTYQGTSGSWDSALYLAATGQTNLMATSGNTFYITGVQLEVGSVATPFERRPYGMELALCQRYAIVYGRVFGCTPLGMGQAYSTTQTYASHTFPVSMRSAPSFSYSSLSHWANILANGAQATLTSFSIVNATTDNAEVLTTIGAASLVTGNASAVQSLSSSGTITFSAEL